MSEVQVKEVDGKWGLYLGENLLGTSKAQFDADFAKQVLLKWKDEIVEDYREN